MGEEATKAVVPESVLKKQKRDGEWALAKKQGLEVAKKKSYENRKLIYKRAEQYSKEYENQEKELIRIRREARLKGGFYVEPEANLLFIIRIRGINAKDPKTRSIMQLLRLRQGLFPGFWLLEITADMYKVNEYPEAAKFLIFGLGLGLGEGRYSAGIASS